jgi:hypothetical protein
MDGLQIRERFDALESQRETLDNTFQFIEKYVVPFRGEFFKPLTTMDEVDWRRRQIFDSTAPVACDILASKIHTNLTSPAIRWFELRFRNEKLNDNQGAKEWLEEVQNNIWQALLESDFNMEIAEVYLDLCSFGTAVMFEEELNEEEWEGIAFTAIPIRDAYFEMGADDNLLNVFRRLQYTVIQLKDKFPDYDFDLLTKEVNYSVDTKHDVVFCVYKRDDVKPDDGKKRKPDARPYGYKYVMHRDSEVLDEGGYYEMPAFVTRWKKVSGAQWGHSPATVCLSDILQLNEVVASTSEARIKEVNPPMKSTERGIVSDLDLSMGGLTMVAEMDELDRLLPPNPMAWSDVEIERLQNSIRNTFFVNKLELKESPAMTATEVMARLQQMMEMFAPTLGRLQADLLDPLIQLTYSTLGRNNMLPPPPEGLSGADLDVEYIGPIPRAQKNERAQSTSMWIGELANLDALAPQLAMLDTVDADAVARGLGYDRGVPAKMMRTVDEVQEIRAARAEQMEQQRQMEMLQQAGKTMNDMGISGEEQETVQ